MKSGFEIAIYHQPSHYINLLLWMKINLRSKSLIIKSEYELFKQEQAFNVCFKENADNENGDVLPVWSFLQFCTSHSCNCNKKL